MLLKRLKFLLLSFWWSVNERFVKILYFNGVMKSLKKVFLNEYIMNVLLLFKEIFIYIIMYNIYYIDIEF